MMEGASTRCDGRALVLGHSFVKRLRRVVSSGKKKVRGHDVEFWGFSGATVPLLMQKASGWYLSKFCIVYVELGTNDLCGWRSAEAVVQDLLDMVHLLQERGAAKVVLGEILFRGKMRAGGPPLEIFKTNVTFVNAKLQEKALSITGFRVWTHDGVRSASLLCDDGVHLSSDGMKRYWRSVRGALLFSLHR